MTLTARKAVDVAVRATEQFDEWDSYEANDGTEWPIVPQPDEFYADDILAEFQNELCTLHSSAPKLVWIAYSESVVSVQLLAIAALRQIAGDILAETIALLRYNKIRPEYDAQMRWAAAVALGLMGPVAKKALPRLHVRLKRERRSDVLKAIEWAIAEIEGAPKSGRPAGRPAPR
jgi:hypothetical protein